MVLNFFVGFLELVYGFSKDFDQIFRLLDSTMLVVNSSVTYRMKNAMRKHEASAWRFFPKETRSV